MKEESNGIGGHVSGAEGNQGELRGVIGGNVGIVTLSLHGDITQYSPATDLVDKYLDFFPIGQLSLDCLQ